MANRTLPNAVTSAANAPTRNGTACLPVTTPITIAGTAKLNESTAKRVDWAHLDDATRSDAADDRATETTARSA